MKIAFNALFLQHPASGSGQYTTHLLSALAAIDDKNEYILLGPRPVENQNLVPFPYQVHPVPALATKNDNLEKIAWEQLTAPAAARRTHADIFHVPHFAPPLFPPLPTVATIHDVIPLRLPAYRASTKVRAYISLVSRAAHNATMIITVSQHARQDIIDALHIPAERIRVIYEAAGDEYYPITDPELLAQTRARYGVGERFVFYLGGLDQRKNVPQLVRAFAHLHKQLGDPDLKLLISGDPDKQRGPFFPDPRPVAEELGVTEHVIYRFVEEQDKPAVYSCASLFVSPTLYEGFGLPPLEAMSCGAPVVCSNRTSLPEVVGDAALTVDPNDTQALVEAMSRVLTDPELQADLHARSLLRAGLFSWRKTAVETMAVYDEVLARRKK